MANYKSNLLLKIQFSCKIMILFVWGSALMKAMPPPDPLQCTEKSCILYNSFGVWSDRKDCHVTAVVYPTTEEELRLAVADANKNNLKVKVVPKFSHSVPKLACPTSGRNESAVLISTARYDSNIDVDAVNMAVTADAGVGLRALIDKVEAEGLSLVAAPYWEGVSVGGMISTGAHGSSWWGRGGAVHDHVIGIRMIVPAEESEGFAKVLSLKEDDDDDQIFRAAKVSLGMLGVISQVTFGLDKGFKRSISLNFSDDGGIENEYMEHANKYEFGDIQWYPSRYTAVYRYDNRVPSNTFGDGINDFMGFQSYFIGTLLSFRASENVAEKTKCVNIKCMMAWAMLTYRRLIANGFKNNLFFTGYPIIGRQCQMQTSGSCLYSSSMNKLSTCPWDPRIKGLFFYASAAIFPASKFSDFVRDLKKLRDINPQSFCGFDVYNGFLIRFIKKSDAYLGMSEDSVVFDFEYYRADEASRPRLNQDIVEEVEQMAFLKYGAKPHLGKNRNLAFFGGVGKKYPNFDKFVEVKTRVDPRNMFSSEWSDRMLFGYEVVEEDGCALEGHCICSEDRHCSPREGYFCQRGLVYNEARVCRYSPYGSIWMKGF